MPKFRHKGKPYLSICLKPVSTFIYQEEARHPNKSEQPLSVPHLPPLEVSPTAQAESPGMVLAPHD